MDYSTRTINDANIFSDSHYLNLKLSSPSPSSLSFDHNHNGAHTDKDNNTKTTPNSLSPIRKPFKTELTISLADELELNNDANKVLVAKFDIFKNVLSKLGGKDRIAKVLQYVLNLLKLYLQNTRRYLVDTKFTNLSLDPRLHYKTPIQYIKLLVFLNSTMVEKKIFDITKNISIFRQMLRFGGTPYRLRQYLMKLNQSVKLPTLYNLTKIWLNEDSLGDFIDLYYGICDEIILLYKLNVFTNPNFKKFIGKHEAYSWYLDILLGLKKNYVKLQENKNRQLQLNIQHQVKQRASILSKRLIENIGSSPIKSQILREFNNKSPLNQHSLDQEINQLKHEEKIIMTDLIRLSFDFVCDSIDIFNLKLNPSVYLISGAISGTFGLSKVWLMAKRELEEPDQSL